MNLDSESLPIVRLVLPIFILISLLLIVLFVKKVVEPYPSSMI